MKVKDALRMQAERQAARNLANELLAGWEPERSPLPVDPPGKLAVAGRIAVSVAAAVMVGALLLFWIVETGSKLP